MCIKNWLRNIKIWLDYDIKDLLYIEDIQLYKATKIFFVLFYFFVFFLIFPPLLRVMNANPIPRIKFILAVLLGFSFANIRSILRLEDIWEIKTVKNIKRLIPVYIPNYLITLVAICFIGNYFLFVRLGLPQNITWYILFCLGFAVDSIFYLITHLGDVFFSEFHLR